LFINYLIKVFEKNHYKIKPETKGNKFNQGGTVVFKEGHPKAHPLLRLTRTHCPWA
jgi:hypothetical protein